MIEEVIAEILDAEAKAAQTKAESEEKAKNITLSTAAELDALKLEYQEKIKAETLKIKAEAEKSADIQLAENAKLAEKEAESIIRQSEKNTTKAIEYIADYIQKSVK